MKTVTKETGDNERDRNVSDDSSSKELYLIDYCHWKIQCRCLWFAIYITIVLFLQIPSHKLGDFVQPMRACIQSLQNISLHAIGQWNFIVWDSLYYNINFISEKGLTNYQITVERVVNSHKMLSRLCLLVFSPSNTF